MADAATCSAEQQGTHGYGTKYSDLVAFADQTPDFRLPDQQARNRLSALKKYLAHLGLDAECQVGPEMASGLDETLVDFVRAKEKDGLADGTIYNLRTFINQWSRMWAAYVAINEAPEFEGIGAAISHYFNKAKAEGRKVSLITAAVANGVSRSAFDQMARKRWLITYVKPEAVAALEEYLHAPPTSLTRFMGLDSAGLAEKSSRTQGTAYGVKLSSLRKSEYLLRDMPARLSKEVTSFIKFKTAISPVLERNENWRTKPKTEYSGPVGGWNILSVDGKNFAATAAVFLIHVRRFFGSKLVAGENPEGFSLVQMCDSQQQADYLEFCSARTGAISAGALAVLQYAQSFLYANGGWLYQQPSFGAFLPTPFVGDEAAWHAWCTARRNEITKRIARLQKDRLIKPGRDTEEAIKDILDRQHPMTALFEMIEAMEKHLIKFQSQPRYLGGGGKAVLQRDILLIKILSAQPLRAKMMRDMKYREDNTGHLYKRNSGAWAIRFAPEDFKNEKGAAWDKPYDVPLPEDLYKDIENYFKNVRGSPIFSADKSDHVFVVQQQTNTIVDHKSNWINGTLISRSRQFLPGCVGFGPHAIRHIVASDYIKNNPASYIVAADVLHDKLSTVMRAYAHLKAADGHRIFVAYRKGVSEAWKKAAG